MPSDRTESNLARVIPLFGRTASRESAELGRSGSASSSNDDVEPAIARMTPHDIELAPPTAEDELAALSASKPIAQLRSPLGWLGTSRPITGTGVPRPGSVSELAKTVGVDLDQRALNSRSMRDIPNLMTIWDAATAAGLIELTSTTASRGPSAHEFARSLPDSLDSHRTALSNVVRRYFVSLNPLRRWKPRMWLPGRSFSPLC